MNAKTLTISFALFIAVTAGFAEDPVLDGYLREAVANNPSYRAALARVQAFDARIPQSRSLPDPMLGVGISSIPVNSWSLNEEEMTQKWVMLSQSLPFPGTRKLESGMAEDERDMQSAMADELRLMLIEEVKETWYRWAAMRETISITRRTQELMNQMADVATAAYRVGKGSQQEILRAQSESLMLESELLELQQRETTLHNRMKTLLNRSLEDSMNAPLSFAEPDTSTTDEELWALIEEHNPRLKSLDLERASGDKNLRLARKQLFPMFTVGAGYMQRDDSPDGMARSDMVSVEVGTSLPLFYRNKQRLLRQEREIEISRVERERADLVNQLRFQFTDLLNQRQRLASQINLYDRAILPQSRQTVDAALADYQVGRADFDALITAQKELLKSELMLVDRRAELLMTNAQLLTLTGSPQAEDQ